MRLKLSPYTQVVMIIGSFFCKGRKACLPRAEVTWALQNTQQVRVNVARQAAFLTRARLTDGQARAC